MIPIKQPNPTSPPDTKSIAEHVKEQRLMKKPVQLKIAMPVLDQETGKLLEYHQLLVNPRYKDVWSLSAADEFGMLTQGIKGIVKPTDTICFINKHEVPQDRFKDNTYIKYACQIRTKKKDP